MQQTTQLTALKNNQLVSTPDVKVDFFSKSGFELACRISRAFATSNAVPEPFRQFNEKKDKQGNITLVENPSAIGNCLVAMEVANSVGLSVISVMQNADVIQGQLRWSAKYQIAAVNASRRFTPLKFKRRNLGYIKAKYKEKTDWNNQLRKFNYVEHEVEIENLECIAWAYEVDENMRPTKEIVQSIPVTMQMAVEEGWYAKDGSKWQGDMRLQMLQYRAASFFASIYAPDVIMGMGRSSEEARDIIDVTPQSDGSYSANVNLQDLKSTPDVGDIPSTRESVDPETGEISQASQNTEQAVSDGLRDETPGESGGTVLEQPTQQQTRQRKKVDLG